MILDAIDVGGGGILVDVPVRLKSTSLDENNYHTSVKFETATGEFAIALDPKHADAMFRAVFKGAHVQLKLAVIPK